MDKQVLVITIPNRDADGWLHGTINVQVRWLCPTCYSPMGEPELRPFCEDGEFNYVHMWENECGHVAKYTDLIYVDSEVGCLGVSDTGTLTRDGIIGGENKRSKKIKDAHLQSLIDKSRRMELREDNVAWLTNDSMMNAMPLRKLSEKPKDNG